MGKRKKEEFFVIPAHSTPAIKPSPQAVVFRKTHHEQIYLPPGTTLSWDDAEYSAAEKRYREWKKEAKRLKKSLLEINKKETTRVIE